MTTATVAPFRKIVRIGTSETHAGRAYSVFVAAEWDGKRLSISGVEGPLTNGDALGSCGQICSEWDIRQYAPGWDAKKEAQLRDVWGRWHLSDMRANCEHQTGPEWDPSREIVTEFYEPNIPRYKGDTYNRPQTTTTAGWATQSEGGILSKPCDVCGYHYGSAWLHEDVPAEVLEWLLALPDTDRRPAWV